MLVENERPIITIKERPIITITNYFHLKNLFFFSGVGVVKWARCLFSMRYEEICCYRLW